MYTLGGVHAQTCFWFDDFSSLWVAGIGLWAEEFFTSPARGVFIAFEGFSGDVRE